MSNSNSKLSSRMIIRKEEMILIKESDVTKDEQIYGNLYIALVGYEKLNISELNQDTIINEKARIILLNNKKLLMDNVMDEWIALTNFDIATTEVHCQLCGHKNIRICYIKNRSNGTLLHVGSDCIKKFPGIFNLDKFKANLKQDILIRKEHKRKFEFEELEIDDLEFEFNAIKQFNEIDILLPFKLYSELKKILTKISFTKKEYIKKGGILKEVHTTYNDLKEKYKSLWKSAESFYYDYKNEKLICNKVASNWLQENNYDIWKEVSMNNGLFSRETLRSMYYTDFVKKFIPEFKLHLCDSSIAIVEINNNSIRFFIKDEKYHYPVFFYVSCKFFMRFIGCHCLTDTSYQFNRNNLNDIRIEQTSTNFEALYNRMKGLMNKANIGIEIDKYTKQYYYKKLIQATKVSKWSDKVKLAESGYKKINEADYINLCNELLFADDTLIVNTFHQIYNQIEMHGGWMTQEKKNADARIAAEAASLQKQRDFIHY